MRKRKYMKVYIIVTSLLLYSLSSTWAMLRHHAGISSKACIPSISARKFSNNPFDKSKCQCTDFVKRNRKLRLCENSHDCKIRRLKSLLALEKFRYKIRFSSASEIIFQDVFDTAGCEKNQRYIKEVISDETFFTDKSKLENLSDSVKKELEEEEFNEWKEEWEKAKKKLNN